jgi:hypothetical protein
MDADGHYRPIAGNVKNVTVSTIAGEVDRVGGTENEATILVDPAVGTDSEARRRSSSRTRASSNSAPLGYRRGLEQTTRFAIGVPMEKINASKPLVFAVATAILAGVIGGFLLAKKPAKLKPIRARRPRGPLRLPGRRSRRPSQSCGSSRNTSSQGYS